MTECKICSRPRFVLVVTKQGIHRVIQTSEIKEVWMSDDGKNSYIEIEGCSQSVAIRNFESVARKLCS